MYICQDCLKDGVKVDGRAVRVADLNVYMKDVSLARFMASIA